MWKTVYTFQYDQNAFKNEQNEYFRNTNSEFLEICISKNTFILKMSEMKFSSLIFLFIL